MKIMLVKDSHTSSVVAEFCDDDCTLELAQKLWPSERPERRSEQVVAVLEERYSPDEISQKDLLRACAEAFQNGRLHSLQIEIEIRKNELRALREARF